VCTYQPTLADGCRGGERTEAPAHASGADRLARTRAAPAAP